MSLEHTWDLTPEQAIQLQQELRQHVLQQPLDYRHVHTVAGVDVGFPNNGGTARAAVVVIELPELRLVDQACVEFHPSFPYIPGLLSFREAPAVLVALERLSVQPEVLLVDGHGLAHPRRFGLACHLGLLLDCPAIGCAKSILVGQHGDLKQERGSTAALLDRGETIGRALRTRPAVRPVYVSIGHRVDLDSAVALTLACTGRYRLPEPARQAHHLASG